MKKNLFKHIRLFTLSINLCILLFARPAFAFSNSNIISNVETFEDGSYIIQELQIIPDNNIISPIASTKSTTAVRNSTKYNAAGQICWTFSLTATFQYNGTTSKATAASCIYTIHQNGWSCKNKTSPCSGNTAKGSATFKYLTATSSTTIGLKCSASGAISNVNY